MVQILDDSNYLRFDEFLNESCEEAELFKISKTFFR